MLPTTFQAPSLSKTNVLQRQTTNEAAKPPI